MPLESDDKAQKQQLIIKRGQVKASLTRFSNFVHKFTNDQLLQLETRLQHALEYLNEFNRVQNEIELLDDTELNSIERDTFEDQFYSTVQKARQHINSVQSSEKHEALSHLAESVNSVNVTNASNSNNVRFPVIELPKFYGEYDKWGQFRDMFTALVHNDNSMDNIKKFYYLLSCLKGNASKIIECIEVTHDNYCVAWDLLKSRYENKSVIIKNHIRALFDLSPVAKDTYTSLRKLTDDLQKHLRSLKTLNEPVDSWDTLLIFLITRKLDSASEKAWEESIIIQGLTSPTLNNLITFLNQRCQLLEAIQTERKEKLEAKSENKSQNFPKRSANTNKSFAGLAARKSTTLVCKYCTKNHGIFHCDKLQSLPVAPQNHYANQCRAQGCKICKGKHNTLLHIDTNKETVTNVSESIAEQPSTSEVAKADSNSSINRSTGLVTNYCKHESQILLSTAVILIKDSRNQWHECRTLLDSGSQPNFITKRLAERLKLPQTMVNVPVLGVGNISTSIGNKIYGHIKSIHNDFNVELTFLVLENITEKLPTSTFNKTILNIPEDIALADINFNRADQIDVLLGASIFYNLLCSGQIKLGLGLPTLQETHLGWVLSGPLPIDIAQRNNLKCNLVTNAKLDQQLEKFWSIEEVTTIKNQSLEELECENKFIQTTTRDQTGHFVVTLPIKENRGELGSSLENAIKRLQSIERRFDRNPNFRQKYTEFMSEYENLGHMTKIDPADIDSIPIQNIFYLPHHGVINESSTTTKLRVVFDGSCKSTSGLSLNDILKVGPTIQDDLFSILLRFRKHTYVVTADIKKMYRQVYLTPQQRDLQRIVWRSDATEEISHYRLNTVTYGTSSAAFLAIRSLHQAAIEQVSIFPEATDIILHDFYVDDLITGSDCVNQACKLKRDITHVLDQYGFELHKWISNDVRVLDRHFDNNDNYCITDGEDKKTLGLIWQAQSDIFKFTIDESNFSHSFVTKRSMLASISKIFDPLGLITPVTIRAKIMMQELWKIKLGWDDSPPSNIISSWHQFSKQILTLNRNQIPRHVINPESEYIELHGFADASQRAYGACIYLKSINAKDQPRIELLCSKSRVAPLQTITLPRLELNAALLLARLFAKVKDSIKLKFQKIYFWTDSTIVLSWLNAPPNTWKLFVANRVSEIQTLTEGGQWKHVSSADNPADLVSRGVNPEQLPECKLWWNGPHWLKGDSVWPETPAVLNHVPERRKTKVALISVHGDFDIFSKYSTLYKLQRVVALCLRFYRNVTINRSCKTVGEISNEEFKEALSVLLRLAQSQTFSVEISALQKSKSLPRHSHLLSLSPFLDSNGLLRVGGRLERANLPYDQKHPIILKPKHTLTRLIILNEHHKHLHAGAQAILNSLRQRFWVLSGRSTVRHILRNCVTCFRANPTNIIRKMANLPPERVSQNRPFYVVGVDFAGPFQIKDGKLRNRAIIKAYMCIYICFTTKAVHLEAVSDLSTHSFLNSLKRFVSRRGLCKIIYSDNGTNFVGSSNEIKHLYSTLSKHIADPRVVKFFLKNCIEWRFIPPRSPHHGGLWEAAVKRAKFHIARIIGKQTVTFEDLSTIFSQIEAIINSRPLTPLSSDPNDFTALTPGHFLIHDSLTTLPQADFTLTAQNRLSQYQILQQAVQHFWKRWSNEYLHELQQRTKWTKNSEEIVKPNSMVLLIDNNTTPLYWHLGRIVKLHRGEDGIARTVIVRTATGETTRAIQRVCVLPVDCS